MKRFLRENPTLAFGLGLPLFIVAVFLLGAVLPNLSAVKPRYAVVFATDYYPGNRGVFISVEHGKAHVVYVGENNTYAFPKLYIYDPAKETIHEIHFSLPLSIAAHRCCNGGDSDKVTPISIPELEALTLDPSSVAPDGYEMTASESYNHDPFFGGLFFSGGYHYSTALKKGAYKHPLPESARYPFNSAHFIGWVIPQ